MLRQHLLAGLEFELLARALTQRKPHYERHAAAFWGKLATRPIAWRELADLARNAEVIQNIANSPRDWKALDEAAHWYTREGWMADAAAEELFREAPDLPGSLITVRTRLQRASLRLLDSINRTFSEVLAQTGNKLRLSFAGEVI
jgi:hypothetical protein